jgi:hypothetical protein
MATTTLTFNQYREKFQLQFYKRTIGKSFIYNGDIVHKFEVFATLYNRHKNGNSVKEIELLLSGMSQDFTMVPKAK